MKTYESSSGTTVTGTFPSTVAKNASGSGTLDGTPLLADYFNDIWGFTQHLLTKAAITPNGTVEVNGNSQKYTAMQLCFSAPGELVFSCNPSDPITGKRILLLQGQVITIANYPDLAAAVYCGDGNNPTAPAFYKTSDAGGTTRSTSGTFMVLADARGLGIMGSGSNAKIFAANASAYAGGTALGAMLTDSLQGHAHQLKQGGNAGGLAVPAGYSSDGTAMSNTNAAALNLLGYISDGVNGTPRTGAYTRGPRLVAAIGIRY